MLLQIWQTHPPMRLIILASVVAIVSLGALARDHGEKRDTGSITALVVHTVGGPACIAGTCSSDALKSLLLGTRDLLQRPH
jgi:hypothetical protein